MTTGSVAVPAIRRRALGHLTRGGHTIEEAVDRATLEHDPPLDEQTAEFIKSILVPGLDRHDICKSCRGDLIGAERALGSCGHCGGRSRTPR